MAHIQKGRHEELWDYGQFSIKYVDKIAEISSKLMVNCKVQVLGGYTNRSWVKWGKISVSKEKSGGNYKWGCKRGKGE